MIELLTDSLTPAGEANICVVSNVCRRKDLWHKEIRLTTPVQLAMRVEAESIQPVFQLVIYGFVCISR